MITELKPEHRQVIILKYEYDMKDEDIAKSLGISSGTVKSRLFRAKNILKYKLKTNSDEERRSENVASKKPR